MSRLQTGILGSPCHCQKNAPHFIMIFPLLFLLVFGLWIYAEHKLLPIRVRVGGGLACMVFLCLATHFVTRIIPNYESNFHRVGMRQMELVLTNGDTQTVIRAVQAYNKVAAAESTYAAARRMGSVLGDSEKR